MDRGPALARARSQEESCRAGFDDELPKGQTFQKAVKLTLSITLEADLGPETTLDAYGFTAPKDSNDFQKLALREVAS